MVRLGLTWSVLRKRGAGGVRSPPATGNFGPVWSQAGGAPHGSCHRVDDRTRGGQSGNGGTACFVGALVSCIEKIVFVGNLEIR